MAITTAAAVERLLHGRLDHEATPPLTVDAPDLSLVEAYEIQREVERALVSHGWPHRRLEGRLYHLRAPGRVRRERAGARLPARLRVLRQR